MQAKLEDDKAPSLTLRIIPVTPFEQNCSLLICKQTLQAVAVDPGGDLDKIDRALKQTDATLAYVLLTHGHIDHCGQSREYADRHQVALIGPHEDDA
ncbi:MAG: MBL fold metallo-hydrolase, partial [Betaproteobacteria bacterium]|nr:MBL fold metallo-hydrolase [Betaproteobacteria bacterium]